MREPRLKVLAIVRPEPAPKPAFVLRFLAWATHAQESARAEAASLLARVCLHSALPEARRAEVATAMAALLDDPSAKVRRALAEALAGARDAPRAIVIALANDETSVAEPMLLRSPLLSDAELADCVATGDAAAQCAVARRSNLGPLSATALAEKAGREAILLALMNSDSTLPARALRRIHARLGESPEIRDALMARADLAARLRAEIALADADARRGGAREPTGERAERAARDARDAALVGIVAECPDAERAELIGYLRERGALTVALILRALLSGDRSLIAGALSELAGAPYPRASGLTRGFAGEGFAALATKAGLQRHATAAFRAALSALDARRRPAGVGLRADLVRATIEACEARRDPALAPILALLWRFAAEAARNEARAVAGSSFAERPALPLALEFAPANDARPRLLTTALRKAEPREDGDSAAA